MKILLLNENPVVSRLVSLSAKKMSYDFEELNAYSENLGNYDVIVVDSDTPAPLKILKEKCDRLIFLAPRNQNVEDIDAQILQKPFLPTDFLNLLNNKDVNKHAPIDLPMLSNDENPYADISLDLDNLNLDDLPDENSLNINSEGMEDLSFDDDAQDDNANKTLETQNLEDENLEQETTKEQIQEDIQTDLDLTLEDSKNEKEDLSQKHTALDTGPSLDELDDKNDKDLEIKEDDKNEEIEKQELLDDSKTNALEVQEELSESQDDNANKTLETQNLEDENLEQEATKEQTQEDIQTDLDLTLEDSKNEKEDLSQEHTALDTEPSLDELDDKNDEDLEDNKELQANMSDFDDLPEVEEQEKEMDFDDLPEDAEFLGQAKYNEELEENLEEFAPVVEEDVQDEIDDFASNLSTQDQIKEELAQLDELDYGIDSDNSSKVLEDFKDEPILDDKELGTNEEEVVVPNLNISDFDTLKESDIQEALGEEILEKNEEPVVSDVTKDDNSEEIVNELSQSIAGAITSSIKDDTLKAALKGMNMNININISFKED
ncbi:highly acidic protein [Campylobacter jejuni]|uniref:highly acidic protein n=1 Tax=Campylobacter sp. 2014D-0258 TaxID=1595914 RepID=UPI0011AC7FDF|nr:highly acidic protein [Campylobacter sp. 2014D-0258]EAI2861964.1 highly acidic protein [Campylobacter jejuni]EAL7893941.1 highly acidic protein [Campylobacter jejuni]EBD1688353.1 highly acidic protein [Campylobacter jejuni]ECO2184082.1 highly acidic protein [Campylobacter jejuni]EID8141586.1 highly acidic protein [Campylobacter jejuni]